MNDVDLTPPAPDDLGFRYSWREGSVPPPYHYEYTISVGPRGDGVVVFRPDYPEEGAPAWEERFRVPESQVAEVYRLMLEARVFAARWETEPDPPVGGSLEWLEVVAQGERHTVPSTLRRPGANGARWRRWGGCWGGVSEPPPRPAAGRGRT